MTAGPTASDGITLFGNTISQFSLIAQRPTPNELQSIDSVSAGFVLTDNGASAYPSYQAIGSVAPTPGDVVLRDANGNAFANNFVSLLTVVSAAGGTTTLTAGSAKFQKLTGTTANQTFQLPAATTLSLGFEFVFYNETNSGSLVIKDGSASTLATIASGAAARITCASIGSTAGAWEVHFLIPSNGSWGTTSGLSVQGPLFAGTGAQFQVTSAGNTTVPQLTIPLTGILQGNGASAVTATSIATLGGITSITGNSGGVETPSSGNFNILGTGSITVAGTANTETVQLTGLTNHSLLVGAGTATITNLGVATNGQIPIGSTGANPVLATISTGVNTTVTNGAGTIAINAPGATRVLLSSQTASASANISFTSFISGTYAVYELEFYNVYPTTTGDSLGLQFSTDNGSTYISTNYISATNYIAFTGTTWASSNITTSIRLLAAQTNATTNISGSGRVSLFNLLSGLPSAVGDNVFFSNNTTTSVRGLIGGVNTANSAINALQITCSTGTIAQGTFNLYGLL